MAGTEKTHYVYGLYEEGVSLPFYIGVTYNTSKRLIQHRSQVKKGERSLKANKFKSVDRRGSKVLCLVLFSYTVFEDAISKEKELIAFYGRLDIGTGILCNHTDGGEGVSNLPAATREKISATLKGRPLSKERLDKRMKNRVYGPISDAQRSGLEKGWNTNVRRRPILVKNKFGAVVLAFTSMTNCYRYFNSSEKTFYRKVNRNLPYVKDGKEYYLEYMERK